MCMNCQKAQEYLEEYFVRSLSGEEEAAIEEHLCKCRVCKTAYEDMEAIITMLRHSSTPEKMPSREFYQGVFNLAAQDVEFSPVPEEDQASLKGRLAPLERFLNQLWSGRSPGMRIVRAAALLLFGFLIATISWITRTGVVGSMTRSGSAEITQGAASTRASEEDLVSEIAKGTTMEADGTMFPWSSRDMVSVIDKSHKSALEKAEKSPSGKNGQETEIPYYFTDGENLVYTVPPPPTRQGEESPEMLVANKERQTEVMDSIQRLKMNLYLSGESRFIPEIHKIETFIADIAEATDRTDKTYFNNLKIFQEAEQCLVDKKYTCAVQNYSTVANYAPGSLMSFLAQFQTANVNYEQIRDYPAALGHYQKCLEQYPGHYISDEKRGIILSRIDILTKNSMDNWRPLQLYHKAAESSTNAAITLLKEIITRYPASTLVKDAIETLAHRVISDEDVEAATAEDVIGFFQQSRERFQAKDIRQLLQYQTADIFQLRLMNCQQALLEFSRVMDIDPQSELATKARTKIRALYRRGITFR